MQQLWRRVDPGFLVVLAIALIAIWPFISRPSLPVETDAELHIFRLHELGLLVRGGDYYPRWAPNFYHGYGYPLFNYYAPLTYYVGLLFELWPWFDAVAAVKAVFVIGLLAAALGMYGFTRDNWGRPSGYVAAAVYIYAPYVQYIDPHARGVAPESFSLGLFPLALWALDRLRKGGGAWAWLASVLLVAALILCHNLMGPLFYGLLLAWAAWQIANNKGQRSKAPPAVTLAALLLGLGVAAFFWLPVYLEREAVTLTTLIGQGGNYDFHTHFLSWREMLSVSSRLDWGASAPALRFNLGVAQWVLAGLGTVMLLARRVRDGGQAAFFALALVGLLFLMAPLSAPVWEALPFLPFFQFPWRLLGPAAAMCALVAGAGVTAVYTARRRSWLTAALVTFTMLAGLPMSQPAPWGDFGEVNTLRMSLIENTGRWLGTTSTADYVPATVDMVPERKGSVVEGVAEGKPMDRVNYETLPQGAVVETQSIRPLHTRYQIDAPRAMRLRLYLFDFPGWQVRLDGERVETELARPEGFIVVRVPEGRHVVDVKFGATAVRTAANVLTAVSLGLALLVAGLLGRGRGRVAEHSLELTVAAGAHYKGQADWWVAAAVMVVTAVTILVLEPAGVLHDNSTGFVAEPAQTDIFADFGEQIALIGYTVGSETAVPGQVLPIDLYWKAQNAMNINFQVFVHLLGPDGALAAQSDKINPGEFPTRWWPLDKYVRDVHTVTLPEDMPPGAYRVTVGLWVQSEGWRLPLLENGVQVGDNVELFRLEVKAE